jgi:hypothetical protein
LQEESAAMSAAEVAEMKARWAAEDEAHRQREEALRARQREVGRELLEFNEQKKAERQAIEEQERRYDHEMIEQVRLRSVLDYSHE